MLLNKIFEPFVAAAPVCVMARGVLENILDPLRIDALFERIAERQYTRELAFSSVVDLMSQVVRGVQPSVHAAYRVMAKNLGVSDQAVYDKLQQVEVNVSAELVRDAARQSFGASPSVSLSRSTAWYMRDLTVPTGSPRSAATLW